MSSSRCSRAPRAGSRGGAPFARGGATRAACVAPGTIGSLAAIVVPIALVALSPLLAHADRLGEQRAGTSSGTFLKIAVDPRGAALGGAFVAGARGVGALSWNPAGLTSLGEPELMFSLVRWPGDIDYTYVAGAKYVGGVAGTVGVQMGFLGVAMDETTEERPGGTGRRFGFRDWYLGVTYARQFTDQLSFGITTRYVREDLGTEVGGPSTQNFLIDAGTLYVLRSLDVTIAFSLQHFGPEFRPGGSYLSQVTSEDTDYEAFAPPTTFRLGVSAGVLRRGPYALRTHAELNHYADSAETVRLGGEAGFRESFFLRAGYDMNADALKFSAGAGFRTRLGFTNGDLDYAYTDGGPLGDVHRLAIRMEI